MPSKKNPIPVPERNRLKRLHAFENAARKNGFELIAGVDEVGRGPLAGPVVAAACIIPKGIMLKGCNDSKKLTPQQRQEIFQLIKAENKISFSIGIVEHKEIDELNIYQATLKAMLIAISSLYIQPDLILVDGIALKHPHIQVQSILQGDSKSHSIAAASIIAKETRDEMMRKYHEQWPHYGFEQHKGYGTPQHLEAIEKHGPCPIHRLSFAPLKRGKVDIDI